MTYRIPFNRPCVEGNELQYVAEAIENAKLSGDGAFGKRCEETLREVTGSQCALLTPSCTAALEMAAILLDLGPGDEVIVPSFTFVSTANAFLLRGARPVFADIRSDTLNLNESLLRELITDRTRAIVPVHYAGVACEMDVILNAATEADIPVVEDNAHGLFGRYQGRALGSMGAFATQSFHETKNVQCGEGGALIINNERWIERAEIIREKGTNRKQFFLGQVDKYTWVDVGSSYLLSELNAAYLFAQLEARSRIQAHRKRVWDTYNAELADWAASNGVRLPAVPAHCEQAYHLYYLLFPTNADRDRFIRFLTDRGINSVFHYLPLNDSPMGRSCGGAHGQCPVAEDVSARLARLPFYNNLNPAEQDYVIDAVRWFECG